MMTRPWKIAAGIILFLIIAVVGWGWNVASSPPSSLPPPPSMGPHAGSFPEQEALAGPQSASFAWKGYQLTPRAAFRLSARVLSRRDYTSDREAELSPFDLALGWGVMSDPEATRKLRIHQHGRWYLWTYDNPSEVPSQRDIIQHSSNMHIIPGTEDAALLLSSVRAGDVIELSGRLVDAAHPDGWRWRTSLSRQDTGQGACELFFVEDVRWIASPRS